VKVTTSRDLEQVLGLERQKQLLSRPAAARKLKRSRILS
jgi:hypothetical protein